MFLNHILVLNILALWLADRAVSLQVRSDRHPGSDWSLHLVGVWDHHHWGSGGSARRAAAGNLGDEAGVFMGRVFVCLRRRRSRAWWSTWWTRPAASAPSPSCPTCCTPAGTRLHSLLDVCKKLCFWKAAACWESVWVVGNRFGSYLKFRWTHLSWCFCLSVSSIRPSCPSSWSWTRWCHRPVVASVSLACSFVCRRRLFCHVADRHHRPQLRRGVDAGLWGLPGRSEPGDLVCEQPDSIHEPGSGRVLHKPEGKFPHVWFYKSGTPKFCSLKYSVKQILYRTPLNPSSVGTSSSSVGEQRIQNRTSILFEYSGSSGHRNSELHGENNQLLT